MEDWFFHCVRRTPLHCSTKENHRQTQTKGENTANPLKSARMVYPNERERYCHYIFELMYIEITELIFMSKFLNQCELTLKMYLIKMNYL